MSPVGTGVPEGPNAARQDARIDQTAAAAQPAAPYWLLWSTGIVALVLAIAAFVLWGVNGTSTLFDMIVALCT